jgi:hypothetical protein
MDTVSPGLSGRLQPVQTGRQWHGPGEVDSVADCVLESIRGLACGLPVGCADDYCTMLVYDL